MISPLEYRLGDTSPASKSSSVGALRAYPEPRSFLTLTMEAALPAVEIQATMKSAPVLENSLSCLRTSQEDVVELIPALRAFARSLCRDVDHADDLVQETLVRGIANLDKFEAGTRLKSWLFTIMRNIFYTKIKIARREVPGALGCVSEQPWTSETQEWTIRSREVARAIDSLPKEQRQVIVSVCITGISYQEAAETSGCEVGTIKSRISRARAKLAAELGDQTSSQAAEANAVIKLR